MDGKKKVSKQGKIIISIFLIIVIGILLFGIAYFIRFNNYKKNIENIKIENIDLSKIEDGEYIGSYDADFVGAKVRVVVKGNKIIEIELLEHKNDQGSAANVIPDKIVQEQKIAVDSISGATASSRVIQKAVSNALSK